MDAGATDVEVCNALDCDPVTLYAMLRREPDFLKARKGAKDHADSRVERSLFKRANGFETEEKTIEGVPGPDGKIITQTVKVMKKQVPPDTGAAIFWLKNRKRADWQDRREVGVSGAATLADLIGAASEAESK